MKHTDNPEKFMTSELDLDEEVRRLDSPLLISCASGNFHWLHHEKHFLPHTVYILSRSSGTVSLMPGGTL